MPSKERAARTCPAVTAAKISHDVDAMAAYMAREMPFLKE
jgi:hypothetical protein